VPSETVQCPDCEDKGSVRTVKADHNHPECYRCSRCSGEFFPDEMKRKELKYSVFQNKEGKTIFIANTDERKANLRKWIKHARNSKRDLKTGKFKGTSRRDKQLLRRIRK
tara:strand:- start:29 stop:358 length:330 start_codon:yes stop_codon:yes gene_type:complete